VKICIKDNGCGIPPNIVRKILNQSPIKTTKTNRCGVGLGQVYNTLKLYNGNLSVQSQEGLGSSITVAFPLAERLNWIADKLELTKGSVILILDEDKSMHHVWSNLLKKYSPDFTIKFFTDGRKTMDFIDSFGEKNKIFLLADYDLKSNISGIQVILESGMKKRSLIVTGTYNDKMMQEAIESSGLKILFKQFLNDIPIVVTG
jgi:hypothetical protein